VQDKNLRISEKTQKRLFKIKCFASSVQEKNVTYDILLNQMATIYEELMKEGEKRNLYDLREILFKK
jgi:hypothetical protein